MILLVILGSDNDSILGSDNDNIIIMIIIAVIMIVFLERLSMSDMLNCTPQVQVQNIKHVHMRHPKQHVFKQSCSNTQLSSKDGGGERSTEKSV